MYIYWTSCVYTLVHCLTKSKGPIINVLSHTCVFPTMTRLNRETYSLLTTAMLSCVMMRQLTYRLQLISSHAVPASASWGWRRGEGCSGLDRRHGRTLGHIGGVHSLDHHPDVGPHRTRLPQSFYDLQEGVPGSPTYIARTSSNAFASHNLWGNTEGSSSFQYNTIRHGGGIWRNVASQLLWGIVHDVDKYHYMLMNSRSPF